MVASKDKSLSLLDLFFKNSAACFFIAFSLLFIIPEYSHGKINRCWHENYQIDPCKGNSIFSIPEEQSCSNMCEGIKESAESYNFPIIPEYLTTPSSAGTRSSIVGGGDKRSTSAIQAMKWFKNTRFSKNNGIVEDNPNYNDQLEIGWHLLPHDSDDNPVFTPDIPLFIDVILDNHGEVNSVIANKTIEQLKSDVFKNGVSDYNEVGGFTTSEERLCNIQCGNLLDPMAIKNNNYPVNNYVPFEMQEDLLEDSQGRKYIVYNSSNEPSSDISFPAYEKYQSCWKKCIVHNKCEQLCEQNTNYSVHGDRCISICSSAYTYKSEGNDIDINCNNRCPDNINSGGDSDNPNCSSYWYPKLITKSKVAAGACSGFGSAFVAKKTHTWTSTIDWSSNGDYGPQIEKIFPVKNISTSGNFFEHRSYLTAIAEGDDGKPAICVYDMGSRPAGWVNSIADGLNSLQSLSTSAFTTLASLPGEVQGRLTQGFADIVEATTGQDISSFTDALDQGLSYTPNSILLDGATRAANFNSSVLGKILDTSEHPYSEYVTKRTGGRDDGPIPEAHPGDPILDSITGATIDINDNRAFFAEKEDGSIDEDLKLCYNVPLPNGPTGCCPTMTGKKLDPVVIDLRESVHPDKDSHSGPNANEISTFLTPKLRLSYPNHDYIDLTYDFSSNYINGEEECNSSLSHPNPNVEPRTYCIGMRGYDEVCAYEKISSTSLDTGELVDQKMLLKCLPRELSMSNDTGNYSIDNDISSFSDYNLLFSMKGPSGNKRTIELSQGNDSCGILFNYKFCLDNQARKGSSSTDRVLCVTNVMQANGDIVSFPQDYIDQVGNDDFNGNDNEAKGLCSDIPPIPCGYPNGDDTGNVLEGEIREWPVTEIKSGERKIVYAPEDRVYNEAGFSSRYCPPGYKERVDGSGNKLIPYRYCVNNFDGTSSFGPVQDTCIPHVCPSNVVTNGGGERNTFWYETNNNIVQASTDINGITNNAIHTAEIYTGDSRPNRTCLDEEYRLDQNSGGNFLIPTRGCNHQGQWVDVNNINPVCVRRNFDCPSLNGIGKEEATDPNPSQYRTYNDNHVFYTSLGQYKSNESRRLQGQCKPTVIVNREFGNEIILEKRYNYYQPNTPPSIECKSRVSGSNIDYSKNAVYSYWDWDSLENDCVEQNVCPAITYEGISFPETIAPANGSSVKLVKVTQQSTCGNSDLQNTMECTSSGWNIASFNKGSESCTCPAATIRSPNGNHEYTFASVNSGEKSTVSCPKHTTGQISLTCGQNRQWETTNYSGRTVENTVGNCQWIKPNLDRVEFYRNDSYGRMYQTIDDDEITEALNSNHERHNIDAYGNLNFDVEDRGMSSFKVWATADSVLILYDRDTQGIGGRKDESCRSVYPEQCSAKITIVLGSNGYHECGDMQRHQCGKWDGVDYNDGGGNYRNAGDDISSMRFSACYGRDYNRCSLDQGVYATQGNP